MRNPFIAGSWVRGENFFGRADILRDILEGESDSIWVAGARRLGKTSLLKQLEYRVQQSTHTPFVPLYWDLQGSADSRGLADGLLGSVEDSESFRRATDIDVEDLEGLSVADMLTTLVRRTVRSGWRLLLLVDEAEEFLAVARTDTVVLPRLRRIFQKGPDVRTVLTATKRLARIDEITDVDTSPFLQ
jgi:AAA+ ATPase superfamily predicted ATPase